MSKPKQLIKSMHVDLAQRGHNCQHCASHRIEKGDVRLGVKNDRNIEYFCSECAKRFLNNSVTELQNLISRFP